MNSVSLIGRLTRDIELMYTHSNIPYTKFTIAVNRKVPNSKGVREADFINCQAWSKAAELLAEYTQKGSQIGIQGRIQTGTYEKDNQKYYTTEIVVESFDFLSTKKKEDTTAVDNEFMDHLNNHNFSDLPF